MDELQWGGYFVVDAGTREVVGSCAFKTPPIEDGTVEIAYFTYPGFEGHGYATGMARKLIELASGSAAVRRVVAHTLPETNASTRVLEKVGMIREGLLCQHKWYKEDWRDSYLYSILYPEWKLAREATV